MIQSPAGVEKFIAEAGLVIDRSVAATGAARSGCTPANRRDRRKTRHRRSDRADFIVTTQVFVTGGTGYVGDRVVQPATCRASYSRRTRIQNRGSGSPERSNEGPCRIHGLVNGGGAWAASRASGG